MRMGVFFLSLVSLTVFGVWTVGERARATRMAYDLGDLRERIDALEHGNRILRERAARLQGPGILVARAEALDLGLVEPRLAEGPR